MDANIMSLAPLFNMVGKSKNVLFLSADPEDRILMFSLNESGHYTQ